MANLSSTIKLKLDSSSVKRGIKGIKRGFTNMGKSVANMATGVAKFATAIGAAVAALAIYQAGKFFADSVKAAADFEALSVSFEVLTGSATKASKILKEIKKFGAETPLTQKDLTTQTQKLLNYGIALDEIMPSLKMLGDVSGGDSTKLDSLATAFGQVASAQKMQGQDLMQFINAGFNPLNEIAARTGQTMGELRDEMSKGNISFEMVRQAFADATGEGGKFNNMLVRISKTTAGKLSNLVDNVDALKIALGTGFNEGLNVGLDALNEFLPKWEAGFKDLGEKTGNAIARTFKGDSLPFQQIKKLTLAFFDALFAQVGEMLAGYITQGVMKGLWGIGGAGVKGVGKTIAPLMSMTPGGDMVMAGMNKFAGVSNEMGKFDRGDYQAITDNQFGSREKWDTLIEVGKQTNEILSTKKPDPVPDPTAKPWSTDQPPAGWFPLFATP
jgi:tape measure domain-containing protein